MNAYDEYMKGIVQPMRQELVNSGFKELTTPEEVDKHIESAKGTSLVVVNSVCGCAAGLARPAVRAALEDLESKPDHLVTVFAGQDREATEQMRSYFDEVPPSSPSIAILKDGKLEYFIPREEIEYNEVEEIKEHLKEGIKKVAQS